MQETDNVVPLKASTPPPPTSSAPKRRKSPRLGDVERALMERQTTIWHARAILDLVDYAQPCRDTMSWRDFSAILLSVAGAAELLRGVDDLMETDALAKEGRALWAEKND